MKSFKAIFMGLPVSEFKEYFPIISRVKSGVIEKEDTRKLQKTMKKNVLLKLISLPMSVTAGYFIPIPADFTSPLLARVVVALFGYRTLTVPYSLHTFELIKEIVIKYDLQNKPDLLNPSREEQARETHEKYVKEYEEEIAKKEAGDRIETFEEFRQRKEDDFEKLVMEYQAEVEQKKEVATKEKFREFLERKKREGADGKKETVSTKESKADTEENTPDTEGKKADTEEKKDKS